MLGQQRWQLSAHLFSSPSVLSEPLINKDCRLSVCPSPSQQTWGLLHTYLLFTCQNSPFLTLSLNFLVHFPIFFPALYLPTSTHVAIICPGVEWWWRFNWSVEMRSVKLWAGVWNNILFSLSWVLFWRTHSSVVLQLLYPNSLIFLLLLQKPQADVGEQTSA